VPIDFSVDEELKSKLAWCLEFVREEIEPLETLSIPFEKLPRVLEPLREEVRRQGLFAPHMPLKWGGSFTSQVDLALVNEVLGRSWLAPVVFGAHAPDAGNAELLMLAIEQTDNQALVPWLERLVAGATWSAFAMTEPEVAGSDPYLIRTTARRRQDSYVISGHKWFITHGSIAEFFLVVARTKEEGRDSLSIFLVPADSPGVRVIRDVATMEHLTPESGIGSHAEIIFDEVEVPQEFLVGQEGRGMALAQARLGPGRIQHCMRWIGVCNRAMEMMLERAASRYLHGSLLRDKGMAQRMIAESYAELEAFRLMTLKAAWRMDKEGTRAAMTEISAIKFFGARVLNDILDRTLQIHGALGYSADMPIQAMLRAARAARIYDGADEVHMMFVARNLTAGINPVDPPSEWIPRRREKALKKWADRLS
jgi:acyl-CoA dehydrogenase